MEDKNHPFLTGLVIGGIAAGIGALLAAPKSGKELISDIGETYNSLASKTHDLPHDIKHKSWHLLHPGESCPECDKNTSSSFAVGALSGALIGAASAFLLAKKPGNKLRKEILENGEEIKEKIQDFVSHLQSEKKDSPISHIADLANLGFNLWQNYQKRK